MREREKKKAGQTGSFVKKGNLPKRFLFLLLRQSLFFVLGAAKIKAPNLANSKSSLALAFADEAEQKNRKRKKEKYSQREKKKKTKNYSFFLFIDWAKLLTVH